MRGPRCDHAPSAYERDPLGVLRCTVCHVREREREHRKLRQPKAGAKMHKGGKVGKPGEVVHRGEGSLVTCLKRIVAVEVGIGRGRVPQHQEQLEHLKIELTIAGDPGALVELVEGFLEVLTAQGWQLDRAAASTWAIPALPVSPCTLAGCTQPKKHSHTSGPWVGPRC